MPQINVSTKSPKSPESIKVMAQVAEELSAPAKADPEVSEPIQTPTPAPTLEQAQAPAEKEQIQQPGKESQSQESFADWQKMMDALNTVRQPGFSRKWSVSTDSSPDQQQFTLTIHNSVEKLTPGGTGGKKAFNQHMEINAKKKAKERKEKEDIKSSGDDWNPNPWAVCHTTVDKKKNPEKHERCVMDVKKKQASASFSVEFLESMGIKTGEK